MKFLTDDEIKLNLMLTSHLDHLNGRMQSFDNAPHGIGSKISTSDIKRAFVMPLVHTFEDKIFSLSRSSFVQYIPLLVIAHANNENRPYAHKIGKMFTEQVMSLLIFKAFCIQQKNGTKF